MAETRMLRLGSALTLALVLVAGCTGTSAYDGCYGEHPAFLVRIGAQGAVLPDDLRLHVAYGGGSEDYTLVSPNATPDVVFCTELTGRNLRDAGSDAALATGDAAEPAPPTPLVDAAPVELTLDGASTTSVGVVGLICELWTQGAATVTLEASGYANVTQSLQAKRDDCGIRTVDRDVSLQLPDAG